MSTGSEILDQTHEFVSRFCVFPSDAALDLTVAWIAHSHCVDADEHLAFETTPRLALVSDQPASGKSMALDMVRRLAFHANTVLDPTPAAFALMVNELRSTVLCDEIDILFGAGGAKRTLVSLLNAGYRKGSVWIRANKAPLPVFSAVALAGLGSKFRTAAQLAPLRSRSVVIDMIPGIPDEVYRGRLHDPMANALRGQLTTWAKRNCLEITESWPQSIPDGIEARLLEVVEPLFQVCDVAGGSWPERIRAAARELLLGESDQPEEGSLSDQLLVSLRDVFAGEPKMSTLDVIDGLYALPKSPWKALWPNRNTAPRELASLLAPRGIEPVPVRLGEQVLRGYHRDSFDALWQDLDVVHESA